MKRGIIPIMLLLFLLSACAQYPDEPLQQRREEPPTTIQEQPSTKGMMTIEIPSFTLAPPNIAIRPLNTLKVTITNTDTIARKFKVTLQGIEEVATLLTPKIITLQPSQSKTVDLHFETKKEAKASTYPATVILISEEKVLETKEITIISTGPVDLEPIPL